MLEVIIDTNIVINGIFQQKKYEDCWSMLKLLRTGEIRAVISKQLLREYQYVPLKVILNKLQKQGINKNTNIPDLLNDFFQYSTDITELTFNAKLVAVTSKKEGCIDPEDNKIYNLAFDSNCTLVITKNISDFYPLIESNVKTKNGKEIKFYTPDQFLTNYKIIKWAESKKA